MYTPKISNLHISNWNAKNGYSHLDYCLILDDLIGLAKSGTLILIVKTYHSSVKLKFNTRGQAKGSGYWGVDKTVLYDIECALKVKDSIQQTAKNNPNTYNVMLFDINIYYIKHLSVQYL